MTLPPGSDTLRLGTHTFQSGEFALMAIINRTPGSFYDNSSTFDLETRQVLDVVASIRGTRPPAIARRGLA